MAAPWIQHPTTLTGENVDLLPLDNAHFEALASLARDRRIWEFYAMDGTDPAALTSAYATALVEREKGSQYPFVVFHQGAGKIIGSTRYLDVQPAHRKLEIGWTWLHPDYWATAVNLECKLLLLTHCFETLKASRVQLKTDENNVRSRKAIQKIGGQFEGVLRNDMIRDNQTKRNSAYYSLIEEEWPAHKPKLTALYEAKKKTHPSHPSQ
jgi:RimJ/RimL family protein N-acetyltransferase